MKTHQQKIEDIRRACIKANPEIVEYEQGCICSGKVTLPIQHLKNCPFYRKGEWACCSKCWNSKHALKGKNKKKMGCGLACECHTLKPSEIIGRDIRLADVIRAIEKNNPPKPFFVSLTGRFYLKLKSGDMSCELASWNLLKDNLEDQSDETVEFIYNLIKQ